MAMGGTTYKIMHFSRRGDSLAPCCVLRHWLCCQFWQYTQISQSNAYRQASVNFDARHNALLLQDIHKGGAVLAALVQGLFKHDGPADVLAQAGSCV